jgi:hypothetical protein
VGRMRRSSTRLGIKQVGEANYSRIIDAIENGTIGSSR